MPGAYLAAIVVSMLGVGMIDARLRLALFDRPGRSLLAVAVGVAFFVAWDAVGIATRSFLKGDSTAFVGIDLAPHFPLEELFFLTFLCYLALLVYRGAERAAVVIRARRERR